MQSPGLLLRRFGWIIVALVWWSLALRFFHSFVLDTGFGGKTWGVADDVYITADFSRTLTQGEGLRWYPGAPKIEGFTSPLWVVALAVLHLLPGFTEDRLGLYVFALNMILLALVAMTLWRCLQAVWERGENGRASWGLAAIVLAAGAPSLCFWTVQGFEIALVAFIAALVLRLALLPADRVPLRWIGVLTGLAFWSRMDGILYCSAGWLALLLCVRDPRRLAIPVAIAGVMVVVLLLARYAYFGDILPNTYYLKISGWPLVRRWSAGLYQNATTLQVSALALLPLCVPGFWRLGRPAVWIAAALLTYLLSLAYSTQNGGDSWFQTFGYDRFGAIGAVFLLFASSALLVVRAWRPWQLGAVCLWSALLLVGPIVRARNWDPVVLAKFSQFESPALPKQGLEQLWARYGKLLREFTEPGATIAVCPAGAIIYFSHRGGIDILGKIDPYIARLPALREGPTEKRCWRPERPGHNKEDIAKQFELRQPELSEQKPPEALWAAYLGFRYGGLYFYARRDAPHVRWDKIPKVEPVTTAVQPLF